MDQINDSLAGMGELGEEFRGALMEAIPCAVFIFNSKGRIIFWNRSAEELTGYSAAEMLGQTCEPLRIHEAPDGDREVVAAVCAARHGGDSSAIECEVRHKGGQAVPVVRRTKPVLSGSGEQIGVVVALVDVTAIKQARGEIRRLTAEVARSGRFGELVGSSEPMRRLYEVIELVAETDASVVIEGETGTGKELVARLIHERGLRRDKPMLAVNCGALAETLLDAELFGHVTGAFTGAVADRAGRFEEADGGTLLLDEVAELSPASQVKLLRVLQEGQIVRVGESRPRDVNVRIIAATHRDLLDMARAGEFREDLYYRLRVVGLRVPALRERREDIPDLVSHFIERFNHKYGRAVEACSAEAMAVLTGHDWPGNVRQLEHALEHAFVVTARDAETILAEALPSEITGGVSGTATPAKVSVGPHLVGSRKRDRAASPQQQRQETLVALARSGGNKAAAARELGLTRAGLYKRLARLGIQA